MLIGQHVALHAPPRDGFIGMICTQLAPRAVAEDAIADARSICMRQYGEAPEVEIFGDPKFTFAYVPGHLHQMVFECVVSPHSLCKFFFHVYFFKNKISG